MRHVMQARRRAAPTTVRTDANTTAHCGHNMQQQPRQTPLAAHNCIHRRWRRTIAPTQLSG
eukprot:5645133-Alexandrium_andersonii.AAC.1